MGRDRKLTVDQQLFIWDLKDKYPRMKAKEVIEAVREWLLKNEPESKKGLRIDEAIVDRVDKEKLSESAIIGFLTGVNNLLKEKDLNPLDKPWTIGSLGKYPLPLEILPVVMDVLNDDRERIGGLSAENKKLLIDTFDKGNYFPTIREVKWIAYIYPLLQQVAKSRNEPIGFQRIRGKDTVMRHLAFIARLYAKYERTCERLKIDCDTSNLDKTFFIEQSFFDLSVLQKLDVRRLDMVSTFNPLKGGKVK
jgi:hypothetical protein